ncbi:sensor histidine kinase [Vagococcus penaei]|uniref:histidine kinase n=1 Tax=Vagococcus penaei TaxID=633807 RepID=A0A1Q2D8L3_9ENTE|nr:sensor histidine kinase [Vagococcus penaei]AQP54621.1 sensor histidine kinase [Vagococcus penaei]RSU06666.1 sensor histidine kinase [Vagococcus penaei]
MLELFILMMERVGLIILLAFLLVNVPYFKKILLSRNQMSSKGQLILVFAIFTFVSNLTGIEITNNQIIPSNILTNIASEASIANTRTLAIGVSGIVGGPLVGAGVGAFAGIHRMLQSTSDSFFYIPSSILVGIISGWLGIKLSRRGEFPTPTQGAIVGACMEAIQMLFVMLFTGSSIDHGIELVKLIALPMIVLNSLGNFIFLSILTITLKQEEQAKAVQTHDVLNLAAQTLPYFREGLHEHSSQEAAKIIKHYTKVSAISITDNHQILAHVGAGSDHHIPELEVITELSKNVLRTGKMSIVHHKAAIGCSHPDCPLEAAIVIPLIVQQRIVGTLKMYFTDASQLTHVEEQLAEGLGTIFSSQIELGEAEVQSKLLKEAEIKFLQAQVNPHFFFNAINTISALMRRNSDQARELLLQLSAYFRGNLQGARHTLISLKQELIQVDAYLSLEQARFPDRFNIQFEIEPGLEDVLVPPYSVQILIENTIKHAFGSRKSGNDVLVTIFTQEKNCHISVSDNGVGIPVDRLKLLGKQPVTSAKGTGTALENLAKRLTNLFGTDGQFIVTNQSSGGTKVTLIFPCHTDES